ncbi:MAG: ParB/RepB/Spo0J family partition protein [Candidatus Liptonbacteria bacterium]|nr:ParB/RepB/Spo0J family partition protein [Candidatus Liptonbacteria bacterium]
MLGRGLESLIPKKDAHTGQSAPADASRAPAPLARQAMAAGKSAEAGEPVFHVEIDNIAENPYQPRRHFDEAALTELAASIREFGVIQPLIVTKVERRTETGSGVAYQLVAGERRLRAARRAGLERVPVIVRSMGAPKEGLEIAIVENLQRADLNPIEAARSFARLQDEFGLTQREIATRVGKSRETISNTVRLLNLPSFMQDALEENKINESQARLLLGIADIAEQKRLFEGLSMNAMSVRELKRAIRTKRGGPAAAAEDPFSAFAQRRLQDFFSAPVSIQKTGTGGRVVISYFSEEELRGLMERLGGGEEVV